MRMDGDSSPHLALVEDDAETAQLLSELLRENGFRVSVLRDGRSLSAFIGNGGIDLVILDLMLPGEDGLSICRRIRTVSQLPIIMLTARGSDVDRIVGLELGADDYISKPFNSRELVARIRGLLRRARLVGPTPATPQAPLRFGNGWQLNPVTREIHNASGVLISVTSAEFSLLLAFCRNAGRVLSRESLQEMSLAGAVGGSRSVDVHVSRLRQKIEDDPRQPTLIKTVRSGGYVFSCAVESAAP